VLVVRRLDTLLENHRPKTWDIPGLKPEGPRTPYPHLPRPRRVPTRVRKTDPWLPALNDRLKPDLCPLDRHVVLALV
jgi:hypothetical protein